MAEETQAPATAAAAPSTAEVVVVEKPVTDSPAPPVPEPEVEEKKADEVSAAEVTAETAAEEAVEVGEEAEAKIVQSVSFKEETNVVSELPEAQKKALEELKVLIKEALDKNEFSAPPPPPAAKEEKKVEEEKKPEETKKEETKPEEEKKEETKTGEEAPKAEEKAAEVAETPAAETAEVTPVAAVETKAAVEEEKKEEEKKEEEVKEETATPTTVVKAAVVDEDGAKTVEAIEETIVAVSSTDPPPAPESDLKTEDSKTEQPKTEDLKSESAVPPPAPEEVHVWGIKLLEDDKTDVVLLKFLRARDFKVKEAFTMIQNTVRWRKEFGIDSLLEEDLGNELDKVVFMQGVDKEGHPVCYNVFGGFQDKELYSYFFSDEEKRKKFLRWRIQSLEKSIRKLDFSPTGINTIVQINDLKNSPGPTKRDLRRAIDQALSLLQDNYPEFVARQVFINVPWWYLAFQKMISPFLTQRTKSKFLFAGQSKSAETLFKYITPEQVPIQYGGLAGETEFTTEEAVTEVLIKPTSKHTIEIPATENSTLVWELRVLGWEVSYGAEFAPSVENAYTVIVSKNRKVGPADEPVICDTFKAGEAGKVVITIDNQSSKKKKLLYRTKTKPVS
ncbi:PATL3 [Linum perenne]